MIWFTADDHFNHEAAISFKGRGFSSLEEMHKCLIEKWNLSILATDTVYVLGDFCFGTDVKELRKIVQLLHGNKILIRGNHDTFSPKQYINCGFAKYYDVPILVANDLILSHEPVLGITGDGLYNIHGHTHGREFSLRSPKHFCVSVECTGMHPISYTEVQKMKYFGGL